MNLDRTELARLRGTFAQIVPCADVVAEGFYARLFERAPETRRLFRTDMEALGEKFMMMMAVLLDGLGDDRRFARACRAQGHLHAGFGVQDRHYLPAAEALLETFAASIPNWNEEDVQVWTKFLMQIARWMQEGAKEAPCGGAE